MALLEDITVRADASGLTEWPRELLQKHKLKELCLSRNLLTTIPALISNLVALRVLRLDRCLLTTVPPEIGMLTTLSTLDLSSNRVSRAEALGC